MSTIRIGRSSAYLGFCLLCGFFGFMLAYFLLPHRNFNNTTDFLNHLGYIPQGKLKSGTYYVQMASSAVPLTLQIDGDSNSEFATSLFIDNGLNPRSCHFSYQDKSDYGVPIASLLTGSNRKFLSSWFDIGLAGRLSIERTNGTPPKIFLGGEWVADWQASEGLVKHQQKQYRYDPTNDDFVEFESSATASSKP